MTGGPGKQPSFPWSSGHPGEVDPSAAVQTQQGPQMLRSCVPPQNFDCGSALHSDSADWGRMPQVGSPLAVQTSLQMYARTVPRRAVAASSVSKLSTESSSRFRLSLRGVLFIV